MDLNENFKMASISVAHFDRMENCQTSQRSNHVRTLIFIVFKITLLVFYSRFYFFSKSFIFDLKPLKNEP